MTNDRKAFDLGQGAVKNIKAKTSDTHPIMHSKRKADKIKKPAGHGGFLFCWYRPSRVDSNLNTDYQ